MWIRVQWLDCFAFFLCGILMKISFVLFLFVPVGDCCLAQKPAKQTSSSSDKVEIEKLISQLGSTSFRERRTASRKLTSKGTAILSILQNALKNENSEAKKRLENLIRDIKQIETERLLQQLNREIRVDTGQSLTFPRRVSQVRWER